MYINILKATWADQSSWAASRSLGIQCTLQTPTGFLVSNLVIDRIWGSQNQCRGLKPLLSPWSSVTGLPAKSHVLKKRMWVVLGLAAEILSSDWHQVLLHSQVTRTVLQNRKQTSRGESCTLSKKIRGLNIYLRNTTFIKVKTESLH